MNFNGRYKDRIQPDKLHVLSLSILIEKLTNSRGGVAANIAYGLSLLNEKPILLGSIGSDAKEYVKDLTKLGVNTKYVYVSTLPTATFTVLTDSDDNQVGGFYPGAMGDISYLTLKPWYNTKSLVVISANDPTGMDSLVTECIEHDLTYIYDVGQQVSNVTVKQLEHGLSKAHMLFVNDYELGVICSRTGYSEEKIHTMIPIVVTTLGAKGTRITGSLIEKQMIIPAVKNVNVVDPTGAGDSFRAGFLHGVFKGYDLSVCARLGSVTATYAIEKHGTQEHTFTLDDVYKKYYISYGEKLS